ncbi:aspartate/glutamate racemase family protein [Pseudoalteromonas sp. MMG012]|uniref:aspartate/glutamate racemase family protein n=1 Tax=Pseudoalteromonas sp. MMG012 TaxID=2822686 RepID=UPI001B3A55C9|nr:aspartate/glutamate racemase family protein [Pseudoalteromonas sp. MMG012]MBQ4851416.1 aspartate/glutamate racemase family protein [Pseudoalteromonas sp. MMG012]
MKTLGLIGGMSWESTVSYYRLINQGIKSKLGGLHSGKIILNSVDFAQIEAFQQSGDWQKSAEVLKSSALSLEAAGAQCIMICTNTMHKVADEVASVVALPLLHIADATAKVICKQKLNKVALLGTRFTMADTFYIERLEQHGIEVLVPSEQDQIIIHDIIYQQLCVGDIRPHSKQLYLSVIAHLEARGAQGVVLGCTEIGLLIQQEDTNIPLFDTAEIHANTAVEFALSD